MQPKLDAFKASNSDKYANHVQDDLQKYIEARKGMLETVILRHFNFAECIKIQKRHIIKDLFINSFNAVWILPSVTIRRVLEVFEKLGSDHARMLISMMPQTMKTGFQREIEDRLLRELFGIFPDSLQRFKIISKTTNTKLSNDLVRSDVEKESNLAEKNIRSEVKEYCSKQNGIMDLSASGGTLFIAYFFAGDYTQDILGIGRKAAAMWSKKEAASDFLFGPLLGEAFYSLLPPQPSTGKIVIATVLVFFLTSVFSTGVGVFGYSLQVKLGWRKNQLHKLISSVEDRLFHQFTISSRAKQKSFSQSKGNRKL